MANFDPGVGTIQATTLEGAALVAAQTLQDVEESSSTNPDNIAVNYFSGDKVVQIQWNVPITTSVATNGSLTISGTNYVNDPNFVAGGDLKSTELASATLEIFQRLQALEKSQETPENLDTINRVQISYNIDNLIGTVTAELPIVFTADAGTVVISADSYLA